MAYGDDIDTLPEADTGYFNIGGIRVSNPIACGSGTGQGGIYVPPGTPSNPVTRSLQIQFTIGEATALVNGITVSALMVDGNTTLLLNYRNIIENSVNIDKDQVPMPLGTDNSRYMYTVTYGSASSTITFSVAVGNGELYNITGLINPV